MIRSDSSFGDLVRNCYWGEDRLEAAERFLNSGEFVAVQRLLGHRHRGRAVLDLGSGTGIASYAFAKAGASMVYALEPDPSDVVGRAATLLLTRDLPVRPLEGFGESIPLDDATVDVVYARAVLHHANDLSRLISECARVLVPGGLFLATREHVVDNESQLKEFLREHPLHRFTQSENAFTLSQYIQSLKDAQLKPVAVLRTWDSVINAFPAVESSEELERLPKTMLARKFGPLGKALGTVPLFRKIVFRCLDRSLPAGRAFSFLAQKPES